MLMDEPSAFGDGDIGWEQQEVLIEFRKERRKIKRSANLILKEMRRRGLLPAIGGEAVRKQLYQDLGGRHSHPGVAAGHERHRHVGCCSRAGRWQQISQRRDVARRKRGASLQGVAT